MLLYAAALSRCGNASSCTKSASSLSRSENARPENVFPSCCGTGTEDYFCGSYNFDVGGQYQEFSTPYSGLHQVIRPDGSYQANTRFVLYRWHITDPIRFEKDLRVTIQDLGWRSGGRYLKQGSDIASVAFWYQAEPHEPFPALPVKDDLEVR